MSGEKPKYHEFKTKIHKTWAAFRKHAFEK